MGCGTSSPVQPDEAGHKPGGDSSSASARSAVAGNDADVAPVVLDAIKSVEKGETTELDLCLPPTPPHAETRFPPILDVPTRIMTLANLEVLTLKNNRINELPEFFFHQLGSLKKLDLSQNALRGLPPSIAACTQLTEFDCSENMLADVPANLGKCTKITTLILFKNQLTALPEELFQGMTELTVVNFFNNKLAALPSSIGALPAVEELSLGSNKLKTIPQPSGDGWKKLKRLALMDNRISTLPSLEACAGSLATLQLSENTLTAVPSFGGAVAAALETLELSTNKLESLDISLATSCPSLKTLNVRRNHLIGSLPPVILQLSALESLDAQNNDIAALPDAIATMPALVTLLLNKNKLSALPGTIMDCPKLMRVRLEGNPLPTLGDAGSEEVVAIRALLYAFKQQCERRGGFLNITGTLQPPA